MKKTLPTVLLLAGSLRRKRQIEMFISYGNHWSAGLKISVFSLITDKWEKWFTGVVEGVGHPGMKIPGLRRSACLTGGEN